MNLPEVVAMDFLIEEGLGLTYISGVVSDTGSYKAILDPLIRAFDFTFSLRR